MNIPIYWEHTIYMTMILRLEAPAYGLLWAQVIIGILTPLTKTFLVG
jgi:hypothetical protein